VDCREARELISAAALDDLRGPRQQEFEAHLAECDSCRSELEEARSALCLLGEAHDAPLPRHSAGETLAPARLALRRARLRRRTLTVAGLVAAAGLLGACLWGFLNRSGGEGSCGCWRYVAGGPGNCRRTDSALSGLPDKVLWEHPVLGTAGAYKPLAWKRLVIIGTHPRRKTHRGGGRLLAFDSVTGEVRWQRNFPAGDFYKSKGFPDRCIAGGRLLVTDGTNCLVLNLYTGRDLGKLEAPEDAFGWGYLTVDNRRAYGLSRDGRTAFCLKLETGKCLWSRRLGAPAFVAALAKERLHVATADGDLMALGADDGEPVWSTRGRAPTGRSTVHAHGEHLVVVSEGDEVATFSLADGARHWKRRIKGASASGAAIGKNAVYLLAGTAALSLDDGRTLWSHSADANGLCSAPTLAGNRVLAAAGKEMGSLTVFASSGELEGSMAGTARRACDGVIIAGGRIYAVGGGKLRAMACREPG
jgi:outer membrane protein assembly factor BamB